jgi:hypothetical protein
MNEKNRLYENDHTKMTLPSLDLIKRLQDQLSLAGISSVVGGSALIASLGITVTINDWDLVIDDDPKDVQQVLDELGLSYKKVGPSGIFKTEALFKISAENHEIDVMVRFALDTPKGVVSIPACPGKVWRGLTMARPEDWEVAYRLMGRHEKATLLSNF